MSPQFPNREERNLDLSHSQRWAEYMRAIRAASTIEFEAVGRLNVGDAHQPEA